MFRLLCPRRHSKRLRGCTACMKGLAERPDFAKVYIVLELASGGDLYQLGALSLALALGVGYGGQLRLMRRKGPLSEPDAAYVFTQAGATAS